MSRFRRVSTRQSSVVGDSLPASETSSDDEESNVEGEEVGTVSTATEESSTTPPQRGRSVPGLGHKAWSDEKVRAAMLRKLAILDDATRATKEQLTELCKELGLRSARCPASDMHARLSDFRTRLDWSSEKYPVRVPTAHSHGGPRVDSPKTPVDAFLLMITDDFWRSTCELMNKFAKNAGPQFVPVTVDELKAFIAVHLWFGLVKLPTLESYWSRDPLLSVPFAASIFNRDRLLEIRRILRVNAPGEPVGGREPAAEAPRKRNPLHKIQPLLDHFCLNAKNVWCPRNNLCVDEDLVTFRGRSRLVLYMPLKPGKWGIKVWKLCDDSRFVCRLDVYPGAKESDTEDGQPEAIVMRMLENCLEKTPGTGVPRRLYLDNFYTSLPLTLKLLRHNVYVIGTIRSNRRGLPLNVVHSKLKPGEMAWRMLKNHDCPVLLLKWKDSADVLLLTSAHEPTQSVVEGQRPRRSGKEPAKTIPDAIIDYRIGMRYVDTNDQMCGSYVSDRRSYKWWYVLFWYLIDTAVVNAYILTQACGIETKSQLQFRLDLIRGLTKSATFTVRKVPSSVGGRPPRTAVVRVDHLCCISEGDRGPCDCMCGRTTQYKCCACDVFLLPEHFATFERHVSLRGLSAQVAIPASVTSKGLPKRRRAST